MPRGEETGEGKNMLLRPRKRPSFYVWLILLVVGIATPIVWLLYDLKHQHSTSLILYLIPFDIIAILIFQYLTRNYPY